MELELVLWFDFKYVGIEVVWGNWVWIVRVGDVFECLCGWVVDIFVIVLFVFYEELIVGFELVVCYWDVVNVRNDFDGDVDIGVVDLE